MSGWLIFAIAWGALSLPVGVAVGRYLRRLDEG